MTKIEKELTRIRNNPTNISKEKLISILRYFNFEVVETKTGSHFKIYHERLKNAYLVPTKRPIKAVYVREVIKRIDEVNQHEEL